MSKHSKHVFYACIKQVVIQKFKKKLYDPVLQWGSTASRLEPLQWGSLLFTTKFPETPMTHLIDLGRMKCWVDLGATQWFWTRDPWISESITLTTRPLFLCYDLFGPMKVYCCRFSSHMVNKMLGFCYKKIYVSFETYAKKLREKATWCSLKATEFILNADGQVLT